MKANATINVSVSSHYREPSYASEVTCQGLLGERVEILEEGELFTRIRQADDYESWISSDQLHRGEPAAGERLLVRAHFVRIHASPTMESRGVREAVLGGTLTVTGEENGWYRVALPDGAEGWAEKGHFRPFPPFSPENATTLAKEFLGYQYFWGGCSPKGFDCSGFVQTVFKMLGVLLPRDSWQQQQNHLLSHDYRDAEAADLLFFGKTPEKVTHVAISLGSQRFIHASGWIRCNSFNETDDDFSPEHVTRFISVNRYRP